MSYLRAIFFFIAFPLTLQAAQAQPFGIQMGTPIERLEVVKQTSPYLYEIKPPRAHPAFKENVMVEATPEHGVCVVRGIGSIISNDAYGTELREKFAVVQEQVSETYGKSKLIDMLRSGSIWKDPREWVMGLFKNERYYQAIWQSGSKVQLPNNVSELLLTAVGVGSDNSFFTLQFSFTNYPACRAEQQKASAKAF